MTTFLSEELEQKWLKSYTLRRLGRPEDAANMIVFLSSKAAEWITGQAISVNGGYFMFNSEFLEYVADDSAMLESDALQRLTKDGELSYFLHEGFWRGMDTYREYTELNSLWDAGEAPWRVWR